MLIIKIIVMAAIITFGIAMRIAVLKKKKLAIARAQAILQSLRGENSLLQDAPPNTREHMLFAACEDAGVTLEEIGTSIGEIIGFSEKQKKNAEQ